MKNNFKKFTAIAALLLLVLALAACGNTAADKTQAVAGDDATNAATEPIVLKVGATPSPHAEILEFVKPILAAEGIDLQIEEFTDYVLPNKALDDKELDANYFQHKHYLDDFNVKNGTNLVSAAAIHFEPLGIYSGKSNDLKNISAGAEIAVPNDTTNEARALQLLETNGIIKLNPDAGLEATVTDITENPFQVKIIETEAAAIPRSLGDVDFAVINGNYALEANVTDKVLTKEASDSENAQEFANILAVRPGDESKPEIQALVKALTSEETRQFITEKYGVSVVPVF